MLYPALGVRNETVRAILYSTFYVYKISAALVTQGIERAMTKHTVKVLAAFLVAGEIFTFIVFEVA